MAAEHQLETLWRSHGLASAFGTIRKEQSLNLLSTTSIALGSNKGNFGITEAASGLLSLLKVSLAVSKGVVPPLETWSAPNALIDFRRCGILPAYYASETGC